MAPLKKKKPEDTLGKQLAQGVISGAAIGGTGIPTPSAVKAQEQVGTSEGWQPPKPSGKSSSSKSKAEPTPAPTAELSTGAKVVDFVKNIYGDGLTYNETTGLYQTPPEGMKYAAASIGAGSFGAEAVAKGFVQKGPSILSKIPFLNKLGGGTQKAVNVGVSTADEVQTTLSQFGNAPGQPANTKILQTAIGWVDDILTKTHTNTVTRLDPATGEAVTNIITTSGGGIREISKTKIATIIASAVVSWAGTRAWTAHLHADNLLWEVNSAVNAAERLGDPDMIAQAQAEKDAVLDPSTWSIILDNIPAINVANKARQIVKSEILRNDIEKMIKADEIVNPTETDDEKYARIRQEEEDSNERRVDYGIEAQKKYREWAEEAEDRDMKEDAKFWRKEAIAADQRAREEAIWMAEFWLEYKRIQAEMNAQQSAPYSNLNFGLL